MTKRPFGEQFMEGAWVGCVMHAISEDEPLAQFQKDTGINLKSFAHRGAMIQAIDKTTGYDRFVMLKFLDWVTENVWGEEGKEVEYHGHVE